VLGAVVLEDALQVLHLRDQPEVAEEDRNADELLDDDKGDAVVGVAERLTRKAGSRKNRPTANSTANATVPVQVPLPISASSSGICAFAEMPRP
jgi:hypothetical protein